MIAADILYQKAKDLPEDLQYQVIDYLEYLWEKWQLPVKIKSKTAEQFAHNAKQEQSILRIWQEV